MELATFSVAQRQFFPSDWLLESYLVLPSIYLVFFCLPGLEAGTGDDPTPFSDTKWTMADVTWRSSSEASAGVAVAATAAIRHRSIISIVSREGTRKHRMGRQQISPRSLA